VKTVIIESPYKGDIHANVAYAYRAALDCLGRNEAPFASHIFYIHFLDDNDPTLRSLGIKAGFAWWKHADLIAFYTDRGWSPGMKVAYEKCRLETKKFSLRSLYGDPKPPGTI